MRYNNNGKRHKFDFWSVDVEKIRAATDLAEFILDHGLFASGMVRLRPWKVAYNTIR